MLEAEELARNKARVDALERELEMTNTTILDATTSMHERAASKAAAASVAPIDDGEKIDVKSDSKPAAPPAEAYKPGDAAV